MIRRMAQKIETILQGSMVDLARLDFSSQTSDMVSTKLVLATHSKESQMFFFLRNSIFALEIFLFVFNSGIFDNMTRTVRSRYKQSFS
mmetsp:Transcript_2459/g.4258  ORF Transcript_2459/g.4258 Transcript_2459/m.4258 type:complete len:88 (-) Transcript_2459:2978-3241(-)